MIASRPLKVVRPLVLVAGAAFILGLPIVAMASASGPAAASTKSTSHVSKRHAKGSAAEEQNEMSRRLQKMTQRLKLTPDQVVRVKEIMQAHATEASELRAKFKSQPATAETKSAMEKAHKELHADTDARLAQVLTADQMSEYKLMRAEHMKREGMKEEKEEAKEEAKEGTK